MKKILILCLLWIFAVPTLADSGNIHPLPVDKAFVLSTELFGNDTILLNWTIAPKHYLYRERFKFQALYPPQAQIGSIILPPGHEKQDPILGKYQVYSNKITIPVPVINSDPAKTQIKVSYQGCSAEGYCYPAVEKQITVNFNVRTTTIADVAEEVSDQEQSYLALLNKHNFLLMILAFLGIGALLSFTPCVLPMIPILSGIIVGHQKTITTGKAFGLSLTYVLSMAITYAAAGILVAFIGSSVQAFFQNVWTIIAFSLIFVLLALSFFGLYQLKLPAFFEEKIATISRGHDGGHYLGVALMGCFATLILSPCVTPALVGVLSYIAQNGDPVMGGAALFALGLGMGLPLLLIGIAGGKLLPKAGPWMNTIRTIFGVLFLGIAIWMISRLIPGPITMALWALLLIVCAIFLGAFSSNQKGWGKTWKGLGLSFFIYGILMLTGAAQGNSDPFRPIAVSGQNQSAGSNYVVVQNLDQFQKAFSEARAEHKPVVLDFYANWCMSCRELDQTTLQNASVRHALSGFKFIRADISVNSPAARAMMRQFGVVAPPTLLFFDSNGQLQNNLTLVGLVSPKELARNLQVSSEI